MFLVNVLLLTLRGVIPVVCIRLMGRELQSITQLNISNRWYVLDNKKLHVSANRGHRQVFQLAIRVVYI
jgi:hypothetical protein